MTTPLADKAIAQLTLDIAVSACTHAFTIKYGCVPGSRFYGMHYVKCCNCPCEYPVVKFNLSELHDERISHERAYRRQREQDDDSRRCYYAPGMGPEAPCNPTKFDSTA